VADQVVEMSAISAYVGIAPKLAGRWNLFRPVLDL
jgi:hypothetical protein